MDFISVEGDELTAIEVKWNEKKAGKLPNAFVEAYRPVREEFITRENYLEKLT